MIGDTKLGGNIEIITQVDVNKRETILYKSHSKDCQRLYECIDDT